MYMYIAESNVFYCILCLCIVTVVLLLYLAIWATISLNTLHTSLQIDACVMQELPPHERQMYEQMARDHRERNKDVVADGRRDNCGKLISVCTLPSYPLTSINILINKLFGVCTCHGH